MRILLVEDEKKIASFIERGLIEQHYIVDVAYDGFVDVHWDCSCSVMSDFKELGFTTAQPPRGAKRIAVGPSTTLLLTPFILHIADSCEIIIFL